MWSRDPISTSVALSSVNDFGMVSLELRKSLLRRSLGDCWKYQWIAEQNYLLGTKKKKINDDKNFFEEFLITSLK